MAVLKNLDSHSLARDAIVLDLGDLRRQADRLIAQAQQKADQIIAVARSEAAAVSEDLKHDARVKGLEAGRREGLEQGRAEGKAEALQEWSEQLGALADRWGQAIDEWEKTRGRLLIESRQDVLALAIAIAGRIVHRTVEADPKVVLDQVQEALALVGARTAARIAVHPHDKPLLEEALSSILQAISFASDIAIIDRDDIERGGCIVVTEAGTVDGRITTQIERIAETLLGSSRCLPAEDGSSEKTT